MVFDALFKMSRSDLVKLQLEKLIYLLVFGGGSLRLTLSCAEQNKSAAENVIVKMEGWRGNRTSVI